MRQTEALTARYHRLGQMAWEMAPEPRQAFRLPADKAPGRPWYLKPAMALAVISVRRLCRQRLRQAKRRVMPMSARCGGPAPLSHGDSSGWTG